MQTTYTGAVSTALDVRPGKNPAYPAGPAGGLRLFARMLTRHTFGTAQRLTAADFMRASAREYGDLVSYSVGPRRVYLLNHPDLITDFFGKDSPHHHRNLVMQRSRDVLGNGLLTSEEPLHMRQRRLANPAFLRSRITSYGDVIANKTLDVTGRWQSGSTIDLHSQMLELALRIVGKCLFGVEEFEDLHAMEIAVSSFMSFLPLAFIPFSRAVQNSPLPAMRRLRASQRYLDNLIYGMIAERRKDPTDRGDLLSMLLNATDTEDATEQGTAGARNVEANGTSNHQSPSSRSGQANPAARPPSTMSDRQLRDECVTVILAGHETTANALSFALHLLAHHPHVQKRLHDEARTILGDRPPTAADYPRLAYATQVFSETMRLYPPVWATARMCFEPYEIAGYRIPAGAALIAPQYTVHRDPRWWTEPDTFDPDRFEKAGAASSARPRNTFFPFGGGSRQCIAEGLAWMEGALALAVIARDWQLTPPPGSPLVPAMRPAISLRPAHGIPLQLTRHSSST